MKKILYGAAALLAFCTLALQGCDVKDPIYEAVYAVKASGDGNGTVKASVGGEDVTEARYDATVTVSATPAADYKFKQWTVVKGKVDLSPNATANPATFTMPIEEVEIRAQFEFIPDFSITPDTDQTVAAEATGFDFAVTSNTPWECLVNDVKQDEGTGDKAVTVTFPANPSQTDPVEIKVKFTTVGLTPEIVHEVTITQAAVPLYAVTITDDDNGTGKASIEGSDVTHAAEGSTVAITATPNAGYRFKQWTVLSGGVTVTPDVNTSPAEFVMPANAVEIKAEFELVPAFSISPDTDQNVSAATTDFGFQVTSNVPWKCTVNNMEQDNGTGDKAVSVIFPSNPSQTDPVEIKVKFTTVGLTPEIVHEVTITQAAVPLYAVTITDDDNGTGKASIEGSDVTQAAEGATVAITATPNAGYRFKQWTVLSGGVTVTPNVNTSPAAFVMPANAVEIKAEFEPDVYPITMSNGGNGTAQADKATAVPGQTVTITATPTVPADFGFSQWVVVSGGAVLSSRTTSTATFTMPANPVEIRAYFTATVDYLNRLVPTVTVAYLGIDPSGHKFQFTIPGVPSGIYAGSLELSSGGRNLGSSYNGSILTVPQNDGISGPDIKVSFRVQHESNKSTITGTQTLPLTGAGYNVVGGVYYKEGIAQGVIYRPNTGAAGSGRVVSLKEGNTPKPNNAYGVSWGPGGVNTYADNNSNGRINMATIKTLTNSFYQYPAFGWVDALNGTVGTANYTATSTDIWYLPAIEELGKNAGGLYEIFEADKAAFNNSLTMAGGVILESSTAPLYWSSTENNPANGRYVNFSNGLNGTIAKESNHRVRAILAF